MDITEENISDVAPQIITILEEWKLSREYIVRLMGVEELAKPRDLVRFRQKAVPFPFSAEIADRFEQIVGIHGALQTSHPHSREMRLMWLRRKNRRFNKISPMAIMLEDGLDGMYRVHIELDCSYGWSLNEQQPTKT